MKNFKMTWIVLGLTVAAFTIIPFAIGCMFGFGYRMIFGVLDIYQCTYYGNIIGFWCGLLGLTMLIIGLPVSLVRGIVLSIRK